MPTGILRFFDAEKGWGFIAPDDRSSDVFLHISAVNKAGIERLVEGGRINFEVVTNQRSGKLCADNVSIPTITAR